MVESLPAEVYDPGFCGQELETTYFDTPGFDLRRARRRGRKYLTLRIRCYQPAGGQEFYALSAKTETQKFRVALDSVDAEKILADAAPDAWPRNLPADLLARLRELAVGQPIRPVVTVCGCRYAVEDDTDRLTLDVGVGTDTGKCLPGAVLEFKSRQDGAQPPSELAALGLRPIKLSKFLWSTLWR
jgi:hypothetical protein